MVLVEFFDREPMDNMIGCLSLRPHKVFFIGQSKPIKKQLDLYSEILMRRGIQTELCVRSVKRNNLLEIVDAISEIVQNHDECCFDLTGGDDMLLVAVGMVYEKYKNTRKIALYRYNVTKNTVAFCDTGEQFNLQHINPTVTVEESIALHGGAVDSHYVNGKRTESWDLTGEFLQDVETMWEISKMNPSSWNTNTNILSACEMLKIKPALSLKVRLEVQDINNRIPFKNFLMLLQNKGLIYDLYLNSDTAEFRYKNSQVRRCLSKAGNILELKTLISANSIKEEDGTAFYSDSCIQVSIDWDGKLENDYPAQKDTENEIDVVLMKELVPVFISCKNGSVNDDELYKLNTVASRFGGSYVKKVLIATHLGKKGDSAKHFRQRAHDMNIILIDDVHKMSNEEFKRRLKNIVM